MTDYLKYWQTDQPVFLRSVAAGGMFFSEGLRADSERLLLLCRQPQTLTVITGATGTGKSTLLKWLHGSLSVATHEVLLTTLVNSEALPGWLTPRLASFLGAATSGLDLQGHMREVVGRLDELIAEQRTMLVIIDTAHLVTSGEALREIASFLSLQALAGSCLSFLLCGDHRLREVLSSLPELATHQTFGLEVAPLTLGETAAYLEDRLQRAGVAATFEVGAIDIVFQECAGILSKSNAFAENCLIEACYRGARTITADMAQAAKRYISGTRPAEPQASATHAVLETQLTAIYKPIPKGPVARLVAVSTPPAPYLVPKQEGSPSAEPPPQDAAGIKLASLFKSEPSRRRP